MALGASYATLAEFKVRIGVTVTTFDTQLTEALATASRDLEKFCNRQFNDAGAVSARVYYPDTFFVCNVDDFSTVTGLVVKTDLDNDGVFETTWTSADYQTEPLNGVVDGETGWPFYRLRAVRSFTFPLSWVDYRANVQVTAQWGWAAVPAPVKEACLMLAEEQYKLKDAPFGVAGYGAYGPIRVRDNPKIASMLSPYRRSTLLVA